MSSNERHGRQSLGSESSAQSDTSALLDAILRGTALGEPGVNAGEASHLLQFPQQQGLSFDPGQSRHSLTSLQNRASLQNFAGLQNLPSFQPAPQYNPFNFPVLSAPFETPGRPHSVPAAAPPPLPLYSTSLPSLASPQQTTPNNKLNSLRLAIATRDPSESVEDVLSPRSLSFLHNHFQGMGVQLPADASWGQIQQLLGQTPRTNLQGASSSLFSGQDQGGLGLPPSPSSLLSAFPSQENVQWNAPQQPPPGESVLDRFLASVNLPANEANARITKMAANLILQQQQQQQEQQRLLRQQQIRQLQESFQLHSQNPPLPSFNQQAPPLSGFAGLAGNVGLGGGLLNPPQESSNPATSPFPSLSGLQRLNPQMTNDLWQAALSQENQAGLATFLNTQKFAAATLHQLQAARSAQQTQGGYSIPEQVAQVIVGQQESPRQRQPGLRATQSASEQSFPGQQNLLGIVAPLTSDAMRRALMAGGALSGQPAEPSMGGSLSQGSGRTGKRGLSSRTENQYLPETATSLEEASAESTPKERKKQRQENSPQPSSKLSFGAIPRAPIFNARIPSVTIPPLPPTRALQFPGELPPPPSPGKGYGSQPPSPLLAGIARPTKPPGGGIGTYSFQAPGKQGSARNPEQRKGQVQVVAEKKAGGKSVGRGAEVDKARGETPVKLVRAKRGQATDPHSVAERIRRDKIAEKMNQLEALVPHHHKLDKASMLEEIIEYVKYMQLQVQVLSIGPQDTAQTIREALPGGLPEAALRRGGDPPTSQGTAAAAAHVAHHLQRSPEQAVRFLLEKGLCLVPAHLAAKLLNIPEQVSKQTSARTSTGPVAPASTAPFLASPITRIPSETEGARLPSTVFSDWEEEEKRAAQAKEDPRGPEKEPKDDVMEVAEAIRESEQEQRENRSESGLASSAAMDGGDAYMHPQIEGEQGVDQLAEIDSAQDFDAMSPGLGEGLDLPGFGKGVTEEEHMATMWDSDPHD